MDTQPAPGAALGSPGAIVGISYRPSPPQPPINALLAALPSDVWRAVYAFLTPYDVLRLRATCIYFRRLCSVLPEFVCRWFPIKTVTRCAAAR